MSASSDLVSVVVPSYDHERHLEEALRSVAQQEGLPLELIVVDDGSHDASVAVAARLAEDPAFTARFEGGVRLIVQENEGAHAAINRGLAEARGAWLTLLNSDDAYAPGRLCRLRDALVASGSQLAFSRVETMDAASLRHPATAGAFFVRRHQDGVDGFPSVGFACLCSNVAISTGNLFFSRALHDAVGPFDALSYCHDWDWLLRALVHTEPIFVREPLYRYRLHDANSFRALGGVAERETATVLRRYLASARSGDLRNALAPSARSWPGAFELVMSRHGFWRYW